MVVDSAAAGASHRLVAVGASNLARLALPLLDAARARCGGAVEAWFALGRGRSFGLRSRLLGRGLGSIRDSGQWERLPHLPPAPTTALLMDVAAAGAPVFLRQHHLTVVTAAHHVAAAIGVLHAAPRCVRSPATSAT